jgi:hypothetical protein
MGALAEALHALNKVQNGECRLLNNYVSDRMQNGLGIED